MLSIYNSRLDFLQIIIRPLFFLALIANVTIANATQDNQGNKSSSTTNSSSESNAFQKISQNSMPGELKTILNSAHVWHVEEMHCSPDGKMLASRSLETLKIWSVEKNRIIRTKNIHEYTFLGFSYPSLIVLSKADRQLFWNPITDRIEKETEYENYQLGDYGFVFSTYQKADEGNKVSILIASTKDEKPIGKIEIPSQPISIKVSHKGKYAGVLRMGNSNLINMELWDLRNSSIINSATIHTSELSDPDKLAITAVSPDGKYLCLGIDKTAKPLSDDRNSDEQELWTGKLSDRVVLKFYRYGGPIMENYQSVNLLSAKDWSIVQITKGGKEMSSIPFGDLEKGFYGNATSFNFDGSYFSVQGPEFLTIYKTENWTVDRLINDITSSDFSHHDYRIALGQGYAYGYHGYSTSSVLLGPTSVKLFDLLSAKETLFHPPLDISLKNFHLTRNQKYLAIVTKCVDDIDYISIWNMQTLNNIMKVSIPNVSLIKISSNGKYFYVLTDDPSKEDHEIHVYDPKTKSVLINDRCSKGYVPVFSQDGEYLSFNQKVIRVRDAKVFSFSEEEGKEPLYFFEWNRLFFGETMYDIEIIYDKKGKIIKGVRVCPFDSDWWLEDRFKRFEFDRNIQFNNLALSSDGKFFLIDNHVYDARYWKHIEIVKDRDEISKYNILPDDIWMIKSNGQGEEYLEPAMESRDTIVKHYDDKDKTIVALIESMRPEKGYMGSFGFANIFYDIIFLNGLNKNDMKIYETEYRKLIDEKEEPGTSLTLTSFDRSKPPGQRIDVILKMYDFSEGSLVITPEGYFSGNGDLEKYIHFDDGSRTYEYNQFYDNFYRPDIVRKKAEGLDVSKLTNNFHINEALRSPPPNAAITFPKSGDSFSVEKISVKVKVEDTGGSIGEIRLYHNGKLVESSGIYRIARSDSSEDQKKIVSAGEDAIYQIASRGIEVVSANLKAGEDRVQTSKWKPGAGTVEKSYEINLINGKNTIAVSAFNGQNTITSAIKSVEINADVPIRQPRLFALCVGNNNFAGTEHDLSFAVKDAKDFASRLKASASPLFESCQVEVLTDVAKSDVISGLTRMSRQMHPEDTFVFYVASHGVAHDDLYYILTTDFNGDLSSGKGTLSSIELMEYSKIIPSLKNIYVLDTCQSGGIGAIVSGLYDARISVLAKSLGMHILAGAKTSQDAIDSYQGNGLFTHFVLKALEGQADKNKDKQVFVFEMGNYLDESVAKASQGHQAAFVRNFGDDFAISTVDRTTSTPGAKDVAASPSPLEPGAISKWQPLIDRLASDGFDRGEIRELYLQSGVSFDASPMAAKLRSLYQSKIRSQRIRSVQERLSFLGYDPGPADGNMGGKTQKAILAFQHVHGLPLDGDPSEELLKRLQDEHEKAPETVKFLKIPMKAEPKVYESVLQPERIEEARVFFNRYQDTLEKVRQLYGVSPKVAVGLLALESRMGKYVGEKTAFTTLSSMALCTDLDMVKEFLEDQDIKPGLHGWLQKRCRQKSDWAYQELKALLQYARTNQLDPVALKGSQYGAIGICQFMPSNAIKYGVDGDGDGRVDLFEVEDALPSMGNYMRANGWKGDSSIEKALYRYNPSEIYINTIMAMADKL